MTNEDRLVKAVGALIKTAETTAITDLKEITEAIVALTHEVHMLKAQILSVQTSVVNVCSETQRLTPAAALYEHIKEVFAKDIQRHGPISAALKAPRLGGGDMPPGMA